MVIQGSGSVLNGFSGLRSKDSFRRKEVSMSGGGWDVLQQLEKRWRGCLPVMLAVLGKHG